MGQPNYQPGFELTLHEHMKEYPFEMEEIDALFVQAEIIELAASLSLQYAEQIDQSILARAFRGELVR